MYHEIGILTEYFFPGLVNPNGLNIIDPQFLFGAIVQPQTLNPKRVE